MHASTLVYRCNENEKVERSTNSEEDDSSTEWNNCVRFSDKPPLVRIRQF